MVTILGAGLSGLCVADHLRKIGLSVVIFEAKTHGGGHIYSEKIDGFTWDEGPHISFTKYEYVKSYFAANCNHAYLEYPTLPTNYFEGTWIAHPAQSNMYEVPEQLRTECVRDVMKVRELNANFEPVNYQEWLDFAFGKRFAEVFSAVYTQKYWTTTPEQLDTDWIGKRIYFPEVSDMIESSRGPLTKHTHYISTVRYPLKGGFYSYIKNVEGSFKINYNKKLVSISFEKKELNFSDGSKQYYGQLISTLPLPFLILNSDAPLPVKKAAEILKCSHVLLVNVIVDHPATIPNHWIYVYDESFYSTRINFTELLSPENGIEGCSGIQVEIYFSDYHPLEKPIADIAKEVLKELISMNLIRSEQHIKNYHTKWVEWANVIFDLKRFQAQKEVYEWLNQMGMTREADDLAPMTDWELKDRVQLGDIILAGRFAQWKYFWTDDCVMRGKYIAENFKH